MVLSLTLYGYTFSNNNAYMTFTLAGGAVTNPAVDFNPSNYKYNIVNSLTATAPVSTDPGWIVIPGLSLVLNNAMNVTAQIPLAGSSITATQNYTIFINCFNATPGSPIYQYITQANSIYTKNTITNMTTFYPLLPNIITKTLTSGTGTGGSSTTTSYIMYTSSALTINIPTEVWSDGVGVTASGPLYIISDGSITVNDSIQNNLYIVVIGNGMNLEKTGGLTITNTSFFSTNTVTGATGNDGEGGYCRDGSAGSAGNLGLTIKNSLTITIAPLAISSSSYYGKGSKGGTGGAGSCCADGGAGGVGGTGIKFDTDVTITYNTNPISFIGIGGAGGEGGNGSGYGCGTGDTGIVGSKFTDNIVVAPGVTNA